MPLPLAITTSVVRSAHKGESHGGVYIVDLETGSHEQVVDWNTTDIEWIGRGHDRGLRGIAFWRDHTYIAASDAILVYDRSFKPIARHDCRYLRHAHEIAVDGDTLWVTSTGFDSLLAFDLARERFHRGYCLRLGLPGHLWRRVNPARPPRLRAFDPNDTSGPPPGDTIHLNSVVVDKHDVYLSGTRLRCLMRLTARSAKRWARIPHVTHNVRPYDGGVLMQHTALDRVLHASRDGADLESWSLPRFDATELEHTNRPADHARPSFGRGLCAAPGGLVIAGSSPSTLTVYEHGQRQPRQTVNLTRDVRNAIHGLEVYPA